MENTDSDAEARKKSENQAIILRSYQVALIEKCRAENSIIFLPTGSGKTCIAMYALMSFGHTLEGSLMGGGKRCLFLAPTKALVYQQARCLQQQTSFRVAGYTSENGVDFWTATQWSSQFNDHQILVMTPAIMLLVLSHTSIKLEIFSIVIIDECHNGVGEQSYRNIMRELQNIPINSQPRIIGLTATLLNRSVPLHKITEELATLERTFHAKIATCDILSEVLRFSADPKTSIAFYQDAMDVKILDDIVEKFSTRVARFDALYQIDVKPKAPAGFTTFTQGSPAKLVNRALGDIKVNLNEYGVFFASIIILYYIIDFEQKQQMSTCEINQCLFAQFTAVLQQMRSMLMRVMDDDDSIKSVLNFSSSKLLKLLSLVKMHEPDCRSIIFVERRTTAITLAFILNKMGKEDPEFKTIKGGFLIGGKGNPFYLQRLNLFELRRMERTMKDFSSGKINTIVATSVLEEGVDVPTCSKVYCMNAEKIHYRNFTQSKGRARDKTGEYVMLTAVSNELKVKRIVAECQATERKLYELLIGKSDERESPSEESISDDLYTELIEPYYVDGPGSAHVNGVTAIPCVIRYCSSLPQDMFSDLKPLLFSHNVGDKAQFALQLPINSPIRDLIMGQPMDTKKLAKRAVFVEAVRVLHKAGELTDQLLPKTMGVDVPDYDWIYPHYKKEPTTGGDSCFPGSKKRRRVYDLKYPEATSGCLPSAGTPCYLHAFKFHPTYEEPVDNDTRVFYHMLKNKSTYAMLSTKPLTKICDFPLYISAGEISCEMVTSRRMVELSENELKLCAQFHLKIFSNIECFNEFLILSKQNEGNSFYVVPVEFDDMNCTIDWRVISDIESSWAPVLNDSFDSVATTHFLSVITPDYRGTNEYYVVTKVLTDMTPMSRFPDTDRESFYSYFKEKYHVEVTNMNQHLLEVKKLPTIGQCFIRPRKAFNAGIRGQRKNLIGDDAFKEILIPELCNRYRYPSILWLKLMLLPTALYRVNELLLVEELHRCIRQEAQLGTPPPMWAPLQPSIVGKGETSLCSTPVKGSVQKPISIPAAAPCQEVNEPMDLLTNLDKVADCDIKLFVDYMNGHNNSTPAPPSFNEITVIAPPETKGLKLDVLQCARTHGPELSELLAAVTAKSANDIVNLERMETLGDSFLKLTSSLFLFLEFPHLNEGDISSLKGKLVSNRNLLYCAQAKGIPAFVQSLEFSAKNDWMPPLAEVPNEIRQRLEREKLNPSVLYTMHIPYNERCSGIVSRNTLRMMHDSLDETDAISDESLLGRSMVHFKKKVLNDKGVADSVEAIIGAYILSLGLDSGLKILQWFGILPSKGKYTNVENLFKIPAPTALLPGSSLFAVTEHLKRNTASDLEKLLKYEFHDKSYLLQALTHATYSFHNITDCYQRLEFLGDAVLDFLITCFIYQEAPHLGPGDITLVRSSLVNNTTFACQIVRFGIHRHMLYFAGALSSAIELFVSEQENRGHLVDEAVITLMEEKDCSIGEAVDVPKALGDLMESLAGAVFLDSGNSLETVWRVFYPLFKMELDSFTKTIPKNSITLLHELNVAQFKQVTEVKAGLVRVRVDLSVASGNPLSFFGFGNNKQAAKISAAKMVLRKYREMKENPAELESS